MPNNLEKPSWIEIEIELTEPSADSLELLKFILFKNNQLSFEELDNHTIRFYSLADSVSINDLYADLNSLIKVRIKEQAIKDEDWQNSWFANWAPLKIGKLTIVPVNNSGLNISTEDASNTIFIKPGLGFGTGHHTSTYTLLDFLQSETLSSAEINSICDLGTGSGILAIACSKLFKQKVLAIDNDPLALTNTKDNCLLNSINHEIEIELGSIDKVKQTYDLITANLYAELLIEFSQHLTNSLNPGGHLLVSGILENLWDQVERAFCKQGLLKITHKINKTAPEDKNSWASAIFTKLSN